MNLPSITCAICCHNSATRLPETLRHLAEQRVSAEVAWEVLVVDNASTDDTASVAQRCWTGPASVAFRVISEAEAGVGFARVRAIREAASDIVSFIDDDNWVCPDWVQKVSLFMAAHPEVGALGGYNIPVADGPFPIWFDSYRRYYAMAGDDPVEGDITDTNRMLVTAGMSLRKAAAQQLWSAGFRFSLKGRHGRALLSGEDQELCLALQLTGWRLWYSRDIWLRHFVPQNRLNASYARRLLRGIGQSSVLVDAYLQVLDQRRGRTLQPHQKYWLWRALASLRDFCWFRLQGRDIQAERALGRLEMLCKMRGRYDTRVVELAQAPWLKEADAAS